LSGCSFLFTLQLRFTALIHASRSGRTDVAKMLLSRGAHPNKQTLVKALVGMLFDYVEGPLPLSHTPPWFII